MVTEETKKALDHILSLPHVDEEYLDDHWATGNCPRCKAEIALGARNPDFGGKTIAENRYWEAHFAKERA